MTVYKQKRQELSPCTVEQMEQQLLSELGQVRAGYDSPSRQDRITAIRDEIAFRKDGGKPTIQPKEPVEAFVEFPFEYRVAMKYQSLFENASRRKKEFNLTITDVKRLLSRKTCAYTGVKLSANAADANALTIDRLDPEQGYVKGNVYAVSSRANKIKNELFEEVGGSSRISMRLLMNMCASIAKMGFVERDQ